ncbi:hypothetical protein IE81DRAFT_117074 [Ceraceosorus guamensis]|uniref:Uncharacterized protein n=1 Tax=Ceraceosorus guamensis TaxID=1522189 RepID=A0A316VYR2_9BASI|nr:hypothetical protein IE81DRAFT_117074 [Ceraceosorus guamensis]PWN42640.1 hypothetical protein IE81DRAFT_117074 [Ceraceosorus guamensis]
MSEVQTNSEQADASLNSQSQDGAYHHAAQAEMGNGGGSEAVYMQQSSHNAMGPSTNGSGRPYNPYQPMPQEFAQGNMHMYAIAGPSSAYYDPNGLPTYYTAQPHQMYYQQTYPQQYGQVYGHSPYVSAPLPNEGYQHPHPPQYAQSRPDGYANRYQHQRGGARQSSGYRNMGPKRSSEPAASWQASTSGVAHNQGGAANNTSASPGARSEAGLPPESASPSTGSGVGGTETPDRAADRTTSTDVSFSARTGTTTSPARSLSSLPLNLKLPAKPPPSTHVSTQQSQPQSGLSSPALGATFHGPQGAGISSAAIHGGGGLAHPKVSAETSSSAPQHHPTTLRAFTQGGIGAGAPEIVRQTPLSRFPPLPNFPQLPDPGAEDQAGELRKALERAKKRDDAWILRLEAIGFEPEEAWKAFRREHGRNDGEQGPYVTDTTSGNLATSPAVESDRIAEHDTPVQAGDNEAVRREPILGIRLLQRVHDLQEENQELEEMLRAQFRDVRTSGTGQPNATTGHSEDLTSELEDAHRLIEALDKALTAESARAEAAESALSIACVQNSTSLLSLDDAHASLAPAPSPTVFLPSSGAKSTGDGLQLGQAAASPQLVTRGTANSTPYQTPELDVASFEYELAQGADNFPLEKETDSMEQQEPIKAQLGGGAEGWTQAGSGRGKGRSRRGTGKARGK